MSLRVSADCDDLLTDPTMKERTSGAMNFTQGRENLQMAAVQNEPKRVVALIHRLESWPGGVPDHCMASDLVHRRPADLVLCALQSAVSVL